MGNNSGTKGNEIGGSNLSTGSEFIRFTQQSQKIQNLIDENWSEGYGSYDTSEEYIDDIPNVLTDSELEKFIDGKFEEIPALVYSLTRMYNQDGALDLISSKENEDMDRDYIRADYNVEPYSEDADEIYKSRYADIQSEFINDILPKLV